MNRGGGFSLVEVALALGVVAFALVAILGMVPVAIDAAQQSRDETRATFIARGLLETLRSGEDGGYVIESAPGDFSAASYPDDPAGVAGFARRHYFAYDSGGELLGATAAGVFDGGGGAPSGAVYLARLSLDGRDDGLVHAEALVETPAAAARDNRSSYPFVTLVAP